VKAREKPLGTDGDLLASEPLPEAAMLAERERRVAPFGAAQIELRRIRPPALVEVGRAQNAGDESTLRDFRASELDVLGRLAGDRADGRMKAHDLIDQTPPQLRLGNDLLAELRVLQQHPRGKPDAIARLVDAARDHQPNVVDNLFARERFAFGVYRKHVSDRRVVRRLAQLVDLGVERDLELALGVFTQSFLLGIVLEIRNIGAKPFAPLPNSSPDTVREAENCFQRRGADCSSVGRDDVRAPISIEAVDERIAQSRQHLFRELAAVSASLKRRHHRVFETCRFGGVEGEHVDAESAPKKRRLRGRAEYLGMKIHVLDVVPARHQPQVHARRERDRRFITKPGKDGVGIPLQGFQRQRLRKARHLNRGIVPCLVPLLISVTPATTAPGVWSRHGEGHESASYSLCRC